MSVHLSRHILLQTEPFAHKFNLTFFVAAKPTNPYRGSSWQNARRSARTCRRHRRCATTPSGCQTCGCPYWSHPEPNLDVGEYELPTHILKGLSCHATGALIVIIRHGLIACCFIYLYVGTLQLTSSTIKQALSHVSVKLRGKVMCSSFLHAIDILFLAKHLSSLKFIHKVLGNYLSCMAQIFQNIDARKIANCFLM